jgi:hypothetical protein
MRRLLVVMSMLAAMAILSGSPSPLAAAGGSGEDEQASGRQGRGQQQQAQPRRPAPPQPPPRRAAPPPRVLPPSYHLPPYRYYFPPVSLQRGFYYHTYFGFYYGPYYGSFYPYPGPYTVSQRYAAGAIQTKVTPDDAEVYVNGYYAGIADDFDGIFQRLYLPAGGHDLDFRLDGYATYRQSVYVSPGDSRLITHVMRRLRPGEPSEPPRLPRTGLAGATAAPTQPTNPPASPFGVLVLCIEPTDAVILVDGEVWLASEPGDLVVHISAGRHRLEVRKAGYQSFVTDIELSEGATTRLDVTLVR